MFRTLSRRIRVGNTVGLLVIQNENAANSHGGALTRLKIDGSSGGSLLDSFLPRVASESCRQNRSYHHKIHRTSKKALRPMRPVYHTNPCAETLYPLVTAHRFYSSSPPGDSKQTAQSSSKSEEKTEELEEKKEDDEKSKGILQRFRDAYKEYGKALVGVHVATSVCWFGTFYFAAANGLDVIPLLEAVGASEKVIRTFQLPGVGGTAVAYLCYKIATPLRYTVTIVGTQLTVRQMRRMGYWEPVKPEDSLRSLMREGRVNVKDRMDDVRDDVKDKITEMRGDFKDKYSEVRGDFKGKYSDWKDKKVENVKGWSDKKGQDIKDRVSDMKDQLKDVNEEYAKKVENRPKLGQRDEDRK